MTDLATRPVQTELEPAAPAHEPEPAGKHRLHKPGGRGGLIEVLKHRTILMLLVRRDVRMKYRYSSFGYFWSYTKPLIQFAVYYFIIGVVLDLDRRVENFAIYVFSGLCLLHLFNEAMSNGAKSITKNRAIVKKIWLPREVFPVAAIMVAAVRFVPTFVVLMVGATATGWYFTWIGLGAAVSGLVIVTIWGLALGVLLSALMVYLREIQHFLEFTSFLTHWLTPMLKPWSFVAEKMAMWGTVGATVMVLYLWNPLCVGVELFHLAFWEPTVDFYFELSPQLWLRAAVMFGSGLVMLAFAQWVFRRLQVRFAEEL